MPLEPIHISDDSYAGIGYESTAGYLLDETCKAIRDLHLFKEIRTGIVLKSEPSCPACLVIPFAIEEDRSNSNQAQLDMRYKFQPYVVVKSPKDDEIALWALSAEQKIRKTFLCGGSGGRPLLFTSVIPAHYDTWMEPVAFGIETPDSSTNVLIFNLGLNIVYSVFEARV